MKNETSVQPTLGDLMARYLERQADAHAAGIATFDGEVSPYEVGPVQPLDPKLAWDEALAVLPWYATGSTKRPQAPPQWAQLVSGHESVVAVACSAGNFPQLMRNFHDILSLPNLADLRPVAGRAAVVAELTPWVEKVGASQQFPQMVLALGALRLAKNFDAAENFIAEHDASIPAEWRTGWENEKAAVLWHSGRHDEARKAWDALDATPPVLFNRGMAALFAGDTAIAKQHLTAAIAQLPTTSAWHHLGRLYLTLADLRRQ